METRRRLLPLVLVALGAVVYFQLGPTWPSDQHLRVVLGDRARSVAELSVRCAEEGSHPEGGEWAREVTFRYAKGEAPRIVSYEPRLRSGDYLVELSVVTEDGKVKTSDRHIRLAGGTASVDLSREEP